MTSPPGFDARAYWEERLGRDPSVEAVGYAGFGPAYNQWLYKVRRSTLRRQMASLPVDWRRAKVLDIGSGTGFYLDFWAQLGVADVTGSDLTSVAVGRLRAAHPNARIVPLDIGSDPRAQGFSADAFDLVSAFDVLFHIVDDEAYRRAIHHAAALLRPGGYFVFSDNFLHGRRLVSPHQSSRPLLEIEAILDSAGLRILRRVPVFFLMNAPVDASRWVLVLWRAFMAPVRLVHALGGVYGAALYPIDVALGRICREGPSTELMICVKS